MSTTADHHGFYRNETPFFPLIQDCADPLYSWSNTAVVRLPARLHDDLNWSSERELAEKIAAEGKLILWEIDLCLTSIPADTAAFYSFSLALEEFGKTIWPAFATQTFGVILFRGAFAPDQLLPPSQWETRAENIPYPLFAAQTLCDYLHRLSSFLPDAVLPFAMIELPPGSTLGEAAQLFSKERFEHTHLILKGSKAPFQGICWEEGSFAQGWMGMNPAPAGPSETTALGVYLPNDAWIDRPSLDTVLERLLAEKTPFRIIPEDKLTEQWDGLDTLVTPSNPISPQGKRKLQGFAAAGGIIRAF